MTEGEQRALYARSLQNSERRLINLLVMEGFDPDTFDETTFEPRDGHTPGVTRQGDLEIVITLDAIAKIKTKMESL
jgi:hypothetical protein